jgi:hypothetical protein
MKKEYLTPDVQVHTFVDSDVLWSSNEGEWDIEGIRL